MSGRLSAWSPVMQVSGSRIVLRRQGDAVAELRSLSAGIPRGRSLVEELLAELRRAASEAE